MRVFQCANDLWRRFRPALVARAIKNADITPMRSLYRALLSIGVSFKPYAENIATQFLETYEAEGGKKVCKLASTLLFSPFPTGW